MTPEEKALIDARREGYAKALRAAYPSASDRARASDAAKAFPYPPEPPTYEDVEGDQWRIANGVVEVRCHEGARWMAYEPGWLTPDFIRGLHALLPPSTEEAPR